MVKQRIQKDGRIMLCLLFLIFGTLHLPWTSLLDEGHKALGPLSAWPTQILLTTRHVCEAIQDSCVAS